jgi:hypothetical protein
MKKLQIKFYLIFIVIAIALNIIIEASVIKLGFVYYNADPKLFGISWFTYLLYFPWIIVTYELGNKLGKKLKISRFIFYFLIGAIFAFAIDQYATTVGLYGYNFNTIFSISKVPIEDFFAVGFMITLSVSISSHLAKRFSISFK